MFGKFGAIESAKVSTNDKGEAQHFGYVKFTESKFAHKAIDALNMKKQENGQVLFVQKYLTKKEVEKQKTQKNSYLKKQHMYQNRNTLFVSGNLTEVSEDEIRSIFEQIGPVLSVKKIVKEKRHGGYAKAYAHVTMEEQAHSQKAIQNLNGSRTSEGVSISVMQYVAPEQVKEEHDQNKKEQFQQFIRELQKINR